MSGESLPTVPGFVGHRRVHRQHWRCFGDAVSFEDAYAEAGEVEVAGALLHRLGAGQH